MAAQLLAPMVGRIPKIMVKVGDLVGKDEEVMILESMKLETGILAPTDGKVKEIKICEGDSVEEDDVLAIIE